MRDDVIVWRAFAVGASKRHDVIDREANADALADGVIVVRRHERERLRAAGQRECVEKITASKKLTFNDGLHRTFVVMH